MHRLSVFSDGFCESGNIASFVAKRAQGHIFDLKRAPKCAKQCLVMMDDGDVIFGKSDVKFQAPDTHFSRPIKRLEMCSRGSRDLSKRRDARSV
jgi:hypothetical protein